MRVESAQGPFVIELMATPAMRESSFSGTRPTERRTVSLGILKAFSVMIAPFSIGATSMPSTRSLP